MEGDTLPTPGRVSNGTRFEGDGRKIVRVRDPGRNGHHGPPWSSKRITDRQTKQGWRKRGLCLESGRWCRKIVRAFHQMWGSRSTFSRSIKCATTRKETLPPSTPFNSHRTCDSCHIGERRKGGNKRRARSVVGACRYLSCRLHRSFALAPAGTNSSSVLLEHLR